ncbi:hypothetical protein AAMO2058_001044300 [Amorphochlora amoebiformis]
MRALRRAPQGSMKVSENIGPSVVMHMRRRQSKRNSGEWEKGDKSTRGRRKGVSTGVVPPHVRDFCRNNNRVIMAYRAVKLTDSLMPVGFLLHDWVSKSTPISFVNIATLFHAHARMCRDMIKHDPDSRKLENPPRNLKLPMFGSSVLTYLAERLDAVDHGELSAWGLENILYSLQSLPPGISRESIIQSLAPKLWITSENLGAIGISYAFQGISRMKPTPGVDRIIEALAVHLKGCRIGLNDRQIGMCAKAIMNKGDSPSVDRFFMSILPHIKHCKQYGLRSIEDILWSLRQKKFTEPVVEVSTVLATHLMKHHYLRINPKALSRSLEMSKETMNMGFLAAILKRTRQYGCQKTKEAVVKGVLASTLNANQPIKVR